MPGDGTTLPFMNAPADEPLLLSALEQGVLRLTLNRPRARNALSSGLMTALQAALDGVDTAAARVIVIAAHGPVFSSGHDLKEMTIRRADPDKGQAAFAALFCQCSKLMQSIVRHPPPIIAEVLSQTRSVMVASTSFQGQILRRLPTISPVSRAMARSW